jgi:hypothetical protein
VISSYPAEKPKPQHKIVKIIGITGRQQGSHDSLCAYYSAASMLCALRPEFNDSFEADDVRADPLFSGVKRRRGESLDKLVASWLVAGMELRRVTGALNASCKGKIKTTFRHRFIPRSVTSYEHLCSMIDQGLPSLLAWDGREIGNHTVVVIGYERHARSRSRWLRVIDPIQMQEVIEWGQLEALAQSPLEVVECTRHDGSRPDKLTTFRDSRQKLLADRTLHERYDVARHAYEMIRGGSKPKVSRSRERHEKTKKVAGPNRARRTR